jgi:hypothetical protein
VLTKHAKSFTAVYTDPRNSAIRDASRDHDLAKAHNSTYGPAHSLVKAAAPPDAVQDDSLGSAHDDLNDLVVAHMKSNPELSYERAFTHIYLHPNNRSLKDRVDSESILRAQARAPVPSFPRYTSPGHDRDPSNVGHSGVKPRGYAGG